MKIKCRTGLKQRQLKSNMKNFLFLLCLLAGLNLGAQTANVNISGHVTDTNGNAVPNISIDISIPPNPLFNYSNTVFTNSNGFYSDVISNAIPQGIVNVSMFDCDSTTVTQTLTWFGDSTYLVADFVFCDLNAPDCSVSINVDSIGGVGSTYLRQTQVDKVLLFMPGLMVQSILL